MRAALRDSNIPAKRFAGHKFLKTTATMASSIGAAMFALLGPAHAGPRALDPAELCPKWSPAVEAGSLEAKWLPEASGIAVSRVFPRLYLNNDSGDGPYFYAVERDGSKTERVEIRGFNPTDVEDIAVGPCPHGGGSCVALADIGDNHRKRSFVEIIFAREEAKFAGKVDPVAQLRLTYPDGPHNAEAMALLPDGGILIVSKEDGGPVARPASVYRAEAAAGSGMLTKLGEIDVPAITGDNAFGGVVTSMDVTSDGKRFILLTYDKAIEISSDLAHAPIESLADMRANHHVAPLVVQALEQQEAIAYDRNDRDILYTSEITENFWFFSPKKSAPIMRMTCGL